MKAQHPRWSAFSILKCLEPLREIKASVLIWILKLVWEFSRVILTIVHYKACSKGDCLLVIHMVNAMNI